MSHIFKILGIVVTGIFLMVPYFFAHQQKAIDSIKYVQSEESLHKVWPKKAQKILQKKKLISSLPMKSVQHFGTLKIGDVSPEEHKPGYEMVASYKQIPPSRFYIQLYDENIDDQCFFDECGLDGAMVGTMGGWFSGVGIEALNELFAEPINKDGRLRSDYSSLMVIANQESKIVGLYLGPAVTDIPRILRNHPNVADFDLLNGILELGPLKVGSKLPDLPPEITVGMPPFEDVPHRFSYYVVRSKPADGSGCEYYECGYYVEKALFMGGWYYEITHLQPEVIEKLGLSASQVARGEVNLIILTDSESKILAIHPHTHLRDIMTILTQHHEVADFSMIGW